MVPPCRTNPYSNSPNLQALSSLIPHLLQREYHLKSPDRTNRQSHSRSCLCRVGPPFRAPLRRLPLGGTSQLSLLLAQCLPHRTSQPSNLPALPRASHPSLRASHLRDTTTHLLQTLTISRSLVPHRGNGSMGRLQGTRPRRESIAWDSTMGECALQQVSQQVPILVYTVWTCTFDGLLYHIQQCNGDVLVVCNSLCVMSWQFSMSGNTSLSLLYLLPLQCVSSAREYHCEWLLCANNVCVWYLQKLPDSKGEPYYLCARRDGERLSECFHHSMQCWHHWYSFKLFLKCLANVQYKGYIMPQYHLYIVLTSDKHHNPQPFLLNVFSQY